MGPPISVFAVYLLSGTGVDTFGQGLHGNAVFDGTDTNTQIATDTFFVFDDKLALAVDGMGNCLVGGVFTGYVTLAAFNAQILVDIGFFDVV
jgi:hypothetical protein